MAAAAPTRSYADEAIFQKPDLRSKGSRFGIHTGNSLKWSVQDHQMSRKDYGLIRKEQIRPAERVQNGRPPLVDDDGIGYAVEYSINKQKRWLLCEQLQRSSGDVEAFIERVWSKRRTFLSQYTTKYTYKPKSDEYIYTTEPKFKAADPDIVAVVCNQLPHPRLRRMNATRLSRTLEQNRTLRACRCRNCRRRERRHRAAPHRFTKSCTRTIRWNLPPSQLRKKGPSRDMARVLNITDLYEISAPLCAHSFPIHHPCHNPMRRRHGGKTLKDALLVRGL